MLSLNKAGVGAKSKEERKQIDMWEVDGEFVPLSDCGTWINKYVYHHSYHATCSSVGLKQLWDTGLTIMIQDVPPKKCSPVVILWKRTTGLNI